METDEQRIIYYYPEEGVCAKRHLWSTVKLSVAEIKLGADWSLSCCRVPEYYMKNSSWDNEKLTECLNGVLKEKEYKHYYLHPVIADKTEIEEKLPPEILLEKLLVGVPCWEYLTYIGKGFDGKVRSRAGRNYNERNYSDKKGNENHIESYKDNYGKKYKDNYGEKYRNNYWEEDLTEENAMEKSDMEEEQNMLCRLLHKYLPRINHFTVVTDRIAGYADFTEHIYDEYGIPAAYMQQLEKRCGRDGRTVILDGRRNYAIPYSVIPTGAVYVDFWSVEQKRKTLEKMRRDISYMSVVKFLDTIAKNGYNTIVN